MEVVLSTVFYIFTQNFDQYLNIIIYSTFRPVQQETQKLEKIAKIHKQ